MATTEVSQAASESSRVMAKEILEARPDMAQIHSKESLTKILDKAEEIAKAMKEMSGSGPHPLVVLSDAMVRGGKAFNPSQIA